jgi:hypothetical protein
MAPYTPVQHLSRRWSRADLETLAGRGGPSVSPPPEEGIGSAVREQVMAEHFHVPPRIDFTVEGLCYEFNGSPDAVRWFEGQSSSHAGGKRDERYRPCSFRPIHPDR